MHEVDFLKAGEKKDADAICMRFTRPDSGGLAHVVVDAGWQEDGKHLVDFVRARYDVEAIDLAIVTHPDGDHIGGMGEVLRELSVSELLIHRLDQRGGAGLAAADAVAELAGIAASRGTTVGEPFQGLQYFGGAVSILGPDQSYYAELVAEQQEEEVRKEEGKAASALASLAEAVRDYGSRVLGSLPMEVPFGEGPGPGPRNNSSVISLLELGERRVLLTGDAGVPAIERALDYAASAGIEAAGLDLIQIPHHGSRRNASSALLDRALGPVGGVDLGSAWVSVAGKEDPKHPAGRVVNAYARRGYGWNWTAGASLCFRSEDAPQRPDYGPLPEMPALAEAPDEEG